MKIKNATSNFLLVESTRRLPGTWDNSDFLRLLTLLEIEDVDAYSAQDYEEVSLMALQDLGPRAGR